MRFCGRSFFFLSLGLLDGKMVGLMLQNAGLSRCDLIDWLIIQ